MNNIINIRRLGLVFRKEFMENWKRYILYFLTMLGIMTVIITWQSYDYQKIVKIGYGNFEYHNRDLLIALSLIFAVFGLIFASTFMTPMNSKSKRINYLLNPSSNFEKYFSRWIIITIGYIIFFFIALWIADSIRVGICAAYYKDIDIRFLDLTKLIDMEGRDFRTYFFSKEIFAMVVSIYFLFQSILILGSTFWERMTFIKTFTASAVILWSYILLCRWVILLFYETLNVFGETIENMGDEYIKNIIQEKGAILLVSVLSVFILTNWTLAFFRFRESEITKRL